MSTKAVPARTFGQWLTHQLTRRDWNKSDLARRIGVQPNVVSRWSRDERIPSPEMVERIADAMLVDVDALLVIAGHRPPTNEVDPDSNLAEILGLVKAVNWEDDEDRMDFIVPVLRRWAERDRKQSVNDQD